MLGFLPFILFSSMENKDIRTYADELLSIKLIICLDMVQMKCLDLPSFLFPCFWCGSTSSFLNSLTSKHRFLLVELIHSH